MDFGQPCRCFVCRSSLIAQSCARSARRLTAHVAGLSRALRASQPPPTRRLNSRLALCPILSMLCPSVAMMQPPASALAALSKRLSGEKTSMLRSLSSAVVIASAVVVSPAAHAQDAIRVGWTIPAEEDKYCIIRHLHPFPTLRKTYQL